MSGHGMKRLRFKTELIASILAGTKKVTWRIEDEKDLRTGDTIELVDSANDQLFAQAVITDVNEQTFKSLWTSGEDHEKYETPKQMLDWFVTVYRKPMTLDTRVKVIRFQLLV